MTEETLRATFRLPDGTREVDVRDGAFAGEFAAALLDHGATVAHGETLSVLDGTEPSPIVRLRDHERTEIAQAARALADHPGAPSDWTLLTSLDA